MSSIAQNANLKKHLAILGLWEPIIEEIEEYQKIREALEQFLIKIDFRYVLG